MLVGGGRRARAQITGAPSRYARLTRPVRIPLDSVTTPWRPVSFTAEAMTVPAAGAPARRVVINGVLYPYVVLCAVSFVQTSLPPLPMAMP